MTNEPLDRAYASRIERAISYICSHLEEDLSVDRLSAVAGFSKFHFHRQFNAFTGFSVAQFVRLVRLKRAAYQLAFAPERAIIDIALDAGFSAPESFSRAFKDVQGRPRPNSVTRRVGGAWNERRLATPIQSNGMTPELVHFDTTRVAVLEHEGPPDTLMSSVSRFIQWRKASGDSPIASCRTFGIILEDPEVAPPSSFRFDICAELRGPLRANDAGILEKVIPGGRCAVARHIGSTDSLGSTVRALYAAWLPESAEQPRDFPCFVHYVERMPRVPEHEQVSDVYMPLC